jgi:hypothetical protein
VPSLAFAISSTLRLGLSGVGLGVVEVGVAAEGVIRHTGLEGAFVAMMPPLSLPGRIGRLNTSYVVLATKEGLPALSVLGRQVVPAVGFTLYADMPSPLPEVCDEVRQRLRLE